MGNLHQNQVANVGDLWVGHKELLLSALAQIGVSEILGCVTACGYFSHSGQPRAEPVGRSFFRGRPGEDWSHLVWTGRTGAAVLPVGSESRNFSQILHALAAVGSNLLQLARQETRV